jgi:benzodiazapine receptor
MAPARTGRVDWAGELPGLLRALALPALAAGIGGAATTDAVRTWYPTLRKPDFNPPNGIFGPVWGVLYLLMGLAEHLVARRPGDPAQVGRARACYRLQLGLNVLWSLLFFGRRSPLAGLVEIGFLWVAIALTILAFARISRVAALLLVPYLLWVTLAAILNAAIWHLNP